MKSRLTRGTKYLNRLINLAEGAEKAGCTIYPTANEVRLASAEYMLGDNFVETLKHITHRQSRAVKDLLPKKNRGRKWAEQFDERKLKFACILKSIVQETSDYNSLMRENPDDKDRLKKELADSMAERYADWYRRAVK